MRSTNTLRIIATYAKAMGVCPDACLTSAPLLASSILSGTRRVGPRGADPVPYCLSSRLLASPDQTYGFRGEKGKSANRVRANSAKEPEASTRRRTMVVKFGEQR